MTTKENRLDIIERIDEIRADINELIADRKRLEFLLGGIAGSQGRNFFATYAGIDRGTIDHAMSED